MAKLPMNEPAFDDAEYQRADEQIRLITEKLPRQAVTTLAREVVRRLAFRVPRILSEKELPSSTDIDAFCAALLSPDGHAADNLTMSARKHGVRIEVIYLGYVAGAAKRLGEMWDEDQISFMEVTLACGKLYRIIRALRHVVAPAIIEDRDDHPAMFALVPGETHSLGIEMATDMFRREGWDVDMMLALDHDHLVEKADRRNYRAIVLVAHSDGMVESLARLVLALRISHPLAHIVVAGHILDHHPDVSEIVGADAVIKDIRSAVVQLRDVIEAG